MSELTIYGVAPSTSLAIAQSFASLDDGIKEAAAANVRAFIEQSGQSFTATEIEAMTIVEELKTINGIDLAALLMRASRVRKIISENMMTRHPAGYQTLDELARDNGMSSSELSNVLDLADVIFPFLNEMGFNIPLLWEEIGKSKFRELTPILKSLITGEPSNTTSVNQSIEVLRSEVLQTAEASNIQMNDEQIRNAIVTDLVENGRTLTNAELRRTIRPTRTPVIQGSAIQTDGRRIVMLDISEEQWEMFLRRMTRDFEPMVIDADQYEPTIRQNVLSRIPELRKLITLMEVA